MCARYSTKAADFDWSEYWEMLRVESRPPIAPAPHYAPTDRVPMVHERADGTRVVSPARWALLPSWAKPGRRPLFNVRSETAAQKFAACFEQRRCILPASGFWEWKSGDKASKKQKMWIEDPERCLISFAGLWAPATVDGVRIMTCTVLTCPPSLALRSIHDRMPVVLEDAAVDPWLGRATPVPVLRELLEPYERLTAHAAP